MWITWRKIGTAWATMHPSLRRGAVFAQGMGWIVPGRRFAPKGVIRRNRPQRKRWPVTLLTGMLHMERTISAIYLRQAVVHVWDRLV